MSDSLGKLRAVLNLLDVQIIGTADIDLGRRDDEMGEQS